MPYDWSGITGQQGLLGSGYLGNLGLGLLSQSGPTLAPNGGLGGALGRAGQFAAERQDQGLINDTRRAALTQQAQQQAAEKALQDALAGGDPNAIKTAAAAAYPEQLARSLFPATTTLDAKDQLQMLAIQQQINKDLQANQGTAAQTVGASETSLHSISNIAQAQARLYNENSALQPGGALAEYGLPAVKGLVAGGPLGHAVLTKMGLDPAVVERQVADLETVQKETAALVTGMQSIVQQPGMSQRSVQALNNMQTSMGSNALWPAKRRVLISGMLTILNDAQRQNLPVQGEADYRSQLAELQKEDKAFTEKGTKGTGDGGATPPPAASPSYSPQAGVTTGGPPPVYGDLPAPPPPAAAAPTVTKVPTTTIDPSNGQAVPTFPRKADGARAVKQGRFAAPDESGNMKIYEVY